MLMLDRYLVAGGRALDLATGASIRWHVARQSSRSAPALFTTRGQSWLIDFDLRGHSRVEVWERHASGGGHPSGGSDALETFRAALADARDGRPRALDLVEPSAESWAGTVRVLAREARLSGFVPIAADALGAVLAQARWRWPAWLKDRSLVVFATESRCSPDATLALFRLATRDARPHLIVRAATADAMWQTRLVSAPAWVHEAAGPSLQARPAPGGPSDADAVQAPHMLVPRSQALLAAGRLTDAEAVARWGVLLTTPGPTQNDARCALARCLIAQRRLLEARATLLPVEGTEADRLRSDLLQTDTAPRIEPAMVDAFLDILRVCQDIDDERLALARASALLRDRLSATLVAFVARERDRPIVLSSAGVGTPNASQMDLAVRVLDTGLPVPATDGPRAIEAAWPVRYGTTVVGALWCRWAIGVPLLPGDIGTLMGVAATAAAPAVHATMEHVRAPRVHAGLVPDLIGESASMQAVRQAIVRAAESPFPVLIEGESGSGKELVARAVHSASARRSRRFCALNCAALADDLVEAELFGHARGAFTGAVAERLGLFEEAQGGTLFLDEVAELGPRVQAKLLRVLQEGEVRRVGESGVRRVDVRIVAATNRPLETEAAGGRFRSDLRYRLDVIRIAIPPLREHIEDLPSLVRHLWTTLAGRTGSRAVLSPATMGLFGAYDWPGNVRELQNVLASVMVAGPRRGVIGPQALPAHIARVATMGTEATLSAARRAFETRYVRAAMARAGGRPTVAARDLGVSRQGLSKLLARLDLDASECRGLAAKSERP